MRVTMKKIAAEADVSRATVSQALSGKGRLGDETRDRIIKVAESLGYRPNTSALNMRAGHFRAIGVLEAIHVGKTGLPGDSPRTVLEELLKLDMHMVSAIVPDDLLTDIESMPRLLRELAVDGFLVSYASAPPPMLADLLHRLQIPAIWCNVKQNADCVYPDELATGTLATAKLIEWGHRRIAYVDPHPLEHFSFHDRLQGYRQAMASSGLSVIELLAVMPPNKVHFYDELRTLLRRPDRPTALLVNGGEISSIALAARMEGLEIPRDLSLLGIQLAQSSFCGVSVSTFRIPADEMARVAVKQLMLKIAAPETLLPPISLAPDNCPGETLAAPAYPRG